jgi:hypothetical protein
MTWSKSFAGTRHEIVQQINSYEFPAEANPVGAVRQFIGGQLPTPAEDTEPMREYTVSAGGGTSESEGHRANNVFVSVTRGAIRKEKEPETPVKQEVTDAA